MLTMAPNGRLVTLLPTTPAQPRVRTDQGQTRVNGTGMGGHNGSLLTNGRLRWTISGTILVWGTANNTARCGCCMERSEPPGHFICSAIRS